MNIKNFKYICKIKYQLIITKNEHNNKTDNDISGCNVLCEHY